MRSDAILACLALGALTLTGLACSNASPSGGGSTGTVSSGSGGTVKPPAFTDTTGEAAPVPVSYPAGPYGVAVGSIIENYDFIGYQDAAKDTSTMQAIQLADFYNPHGKDPTYKPASAAEDDRLFPATTGYENAGKLKPTVLLIDIASVWCGPCNDEAGTVLPSKHAEYLPCGGEFLLQLADSATPGTPATPKNLFNWTKKYGVDFPGAIDPSYKLDALYTVNAFPQNLVVDTTTMKIVEVIAGEAIPGYCGAGNGDICNVDSDCQTCTSGMCGDASSCGASTDCTAVTCTKFPFWVTYEKYLDKTRAGCNVP
jgi:hypothetical protein